MWFIITLILELKNKKEKIICMAESPIQKDSFPDFEILHNKVIALIKKYNNIFFNLNGSKIITDDQYTIDYIDIYTTQLKPYEIKKNIKDLLY